MKRLHVVEVEGRDRPKFPDSCVICGRQCAEKRVSLIVTDEGSRVDFYLYGLPLKAAQGPQLEVPVHDSCAKGIRNTFFRQAAIVVLAAALVVGTVGVWGGYIGVALAVAFAFFVAFFIRQALKGMPFEFQLARTGYVLMFDDRSYAETVAYLNRARVGVRRDAHTGD